MKAIEYRKIELKKKVCSITSKTKLLPVNLKS